MVDKTKSSPIPERTAQVEKKKDEKSSSPPDPKFVRGTIEPTTKKEH